MFSPDNTNYIVFCRPCRQGQLPSGLACPNSAIPSSSLVGGVMRVIFPSHLHLEMKRRVFTRGPTPRQQIKIILDQSSHFTAISFPLHLLSRISCIKKEGWNGYEPGQDPMKLSDANLYRKLVIASGGLSTSTACHICRSTKPL